MARLTVLAGLPGAGKSTWAVNHGGSALRLSTDALRLDPSLDRGLWFRSMGRRAAAALEAGRDVVVDACSLKQSHRAAWRRLASARGAEVVLVLVDTPLEVCLARNAKRDAPAAPDRIRRMARELASERSRMRREPWDRVVVV